MKKILAILTAAVTLGFVSSASASFYTDPQLDTFFFAQGTTKTWNFDLDQDTLYGLDIDGLDLATINWSTIPFVDINAEDEVTSAFFTIGYIDDQLFDKKEKFTLTLDGSAQTIVGWSNYLLGGKLVNVTAALADHELTVSLTSVQGDFYAGLTAVSGEFIDNSPAPVPEPSTILLMGLGLAGLVGYNRKRSSKKA